MEEAKEQLRITLFLCHLYGQPAKKSSRILLEKLWAKALDGVTVQVLINMSHPKSRGCASTLISGQWLMQKGCHVRRMEPTRCMHSKSIVVDSTKMVVGSHNWTADSLLRNRELSIVTTESETILAATAAFDETWRTSVDIYNERAPKHSRPS